MGPQRAVHHIDIRRISIHPSRVGWDKYLAVRGSGLGYFNPPIPCGMGPPARRQIVATLDISIHPSRVGWDSLLSVFVDMPRYFNPPIPCGMGRSYLRSFNLIYMISIHPSRVGWDKSPACFAAAVGNFNPPIPCGMGRRWQEAGQRHKGFQSTHPVWDGTRGRGERPHYFRISIHPSRVGWDRAGEGCRRRAADFNPPIPCGMGLATSFSSR